MAETFKVPDWRNADPEELEPHFSRWMLELTAQGLHGKADIATVLAMQDTRIEELQRQLAESTASTLIDAWCTEHDGKISWAKATQIVAIVTKQPDAERDRLLHLGDQDGACEMCGRSAIKLERQLADMKNDYIGMCAVVRERDTQLATARQDERERCAKVCDDEASRSFEREANPLPYDGDSIPMIQGHKGVTARLLAAAIRALPDEEGK